MMSMLQIIIILSALLILMTLASGFMVVKFRRTRQKMQQELADEKIVTAYFLYAPDIILVLDLSGKISFVNQAVMDQLNYESQSLVSVHIHEILPADSIDEWPAMLKHVYEFKSFHGQIRLKHKDGSVQKYDYRSSLITEKENPPKIICSLRKTQIQTTISPGEFYLNDILEVLPYGCLISDQDWRVLNGNEKFYQIMGMMRTESTGKNFMDFVDASSLNDARNLADESGSNPERGKMIRLLLADGSFVQVKMAIKKSAQHHSRIILVMPPEKSIRTEVKASSVAEPIPDPRISKKSTGARTVLLVEDNQSLLRMTAKILERNGHRVLMASKASEALEILNNSYDEIAVIVSDIFMPDINGLQLAQEIHSHYADLPVIILTGKIDDIPSEIYKMKNIFKVLAKPADPGELNRQIEAAIKIKME